MRRRCAPKQRLLEIVYGEPRSEQPNVERSLRGQSVPGGKYPNPHRWLAVLRFHQRHAPEEAVAADAADEIGIGEHLVAERAGFFRRGSAAAVAIYVLARAQRAGNAARDLRDSRL